MGQDMNLEGSNPTTTGGPPIVFSTLAFESPSSDSVLSSEGEDVHSSISLEITFL